MNFNPHSPCGERLDFLLLFFLLFSISIHTPHAGSDIHNTKEVLYYEISIHTPHAGSDFHFPFHVSGNSCISIHTPHAGSDQFIGICFLCLFISIHTPHAGSDLMALSKNGCLLLFQSTLPMRGATVFFEFLSRLISLFQSTLPMRGATVSLMILSMYIFISIHTPHAGSDTGLSIGGNMVPEISIHTPHAGSDHIFTINGFPKSLFQSTLPMRGATGVSQTQNPCLSISIHTPHAGSDGSINVYLSSSKRFQSTLPMRGATWIRHIIALIFFQFQSTLPMRGATAKVTEFTLNLKTKFMTFGTKTNCETLQSSVSRICSNEKNYISQVRISKQFMIASHSHIYKISGSSGIYDALFPKCSTFF